MVDKKKGASVLPYVWFFFTIQPMFMSIKPYKTQEVLWKR